MYALHLIEPLTRRRKSQCHGRDGSPTRVFLRDTRISGRELGEGWKGFLMNPASFASAERMGTRSLETATDGLSGPSGRSDRRRGSASRATRDTGLRAGGAARRASPIRRCARVENQDTVGLADGRQPVRDPDRSPTVPDASLISAQLHRKGQASFIALIERFRWNGLPPGRTLVLRTGAPM